MTLKVSCPTCQKEIIWNNDNSYRPFCSKRCQLIDLGEWADESKKISQPIAGNQPIDEAFLDELEDSLLKADNFFVE